MSLCEAIHGRAAMAELRSINGSMASSWERKGTEGEGAWVGCGLGRVRAAGGVPWGIGPAARLVRSELLCRCSLLCVLNELDVRKERRRKERRKRKWRKRKEKKKKKYEIFYKLKNFQGEK
jgi:hypothetical protein